ncbi:diguanylate cyclase domain-containing protein [Aquitalea sp. ASV15]|uniref:sensor domain-containing diguanylate cyclase n=1 Tax=Aquitalea sp. ASV15 TaxID=2795104 RepID=UPI0018ED9484|nr:diguanylate cyclase [Aquitalea sp. ASV15]
MRKQQQAKGKRAKWLAAIFLASTLLVVVLDLAGTRRQGESEARNQAAGLSELLEERLSSGLRETSLILKSASDSTLVQLLLNKHMLSQEQEQRIDLQMHGKLRQMPYLKQIDILDSSCYLLYSSQKHSPSSQLKTDYCRWYHRNGAQDSSFTSTRREQGQDGIVLVQKLLNQDDEAIGMVVGVLDRHFFQAEVAKLPVGRFGEILVLDQRQMLQASWPAQAGRMDQPLNELQSTEVLDRHDNYLQFRARSILDQEMRLYSSRLMEGFPFRVVVGIAERDFTRAYNDKATLAVLAWLFTAGLTMLTLRNHLASIRQNRLLSTSAARIRESEELARLTLDTAPVALLLVATDTLRILRANAPAREMLQLPAAPQRADGQTAMLDLPLQLAPVCDWLRSGEIVANREAELERADQSKLWAIVSVELMPQQQIPAALIALYDISERKALENELEEKNRLLNEMAITDPLTRLSNRRHADQTLKEELQRCERYSQPMSVAVFDIDHFKQFNDSFGHQAGDNVLLAVANAAVDCTRSTDVCARIGGEEFLVIFPCTRLRDAEKVMARVQQVLAGTVFPFTDEKVTFSGGITAWRPGDTPSSMLSRADKLLYQAKMAGRDLMLSDGNPD